MVFREQKIDYYLAMGAHGSPAAGYKILYAKFLLFFDRGFRGRDIFGGKLILQLSLQLRVIHVHVSDVEAEVALLCPMSGLSAAPAGVGSGLVFPPATHFAHSNPSPGNPVPMDIDAARKTKAAPDTCRRCGKTGHWAKDCELRFDVRYMDTDEIERELENKFAAKDVASTEPPVEEEEELSIEDFVSRSR